MSNASRRLSFVCFYAQGISPLTPSDAVRPARLFELFSGKMCVCLCVFRLGGGLGCVCLTQRRTAAPT